MEWCEMMCKIQNWQCWFNLRRHIYKSKTNNPTTFLQLFFFLLLLFSFFRHSLLSPTKSSPFSSSSFPHQWNNTNNQTKLPNSNLTASIPNFLSRFRENRPTPNFPRNERGGDGIAAKNIIFQSFIWRSLFRSFCWPCSESDQGVPRWGIVEISKNLLQNLNWL